MQLAEDEGLPRLFDRPFRPETGGPKQFTGEAGKYGKGAEAEKVLTESMNFIAKGAGLFLGVGLASQGVDGLEALDAEPEPGSLGSDEEFETRRELE
eukprot:g32772.t1